ncbi:MAG: helix-turn-helix transcriptional regulator [Candidatus Helarchaeota archaeon]|nr:helix-turn-helix transcriptional regulator [Candidatus Helarchaeota archaeon]
MSGLAVEDVLQSKGRIKILKVLARELEVNISEIVRRVHLNHSSVRYHLHHLVQADLVQEKVFGRIRIYRFRIETIRARALLNLFDVWESNHL